MSPLSLVVIAFMLALVAMSFAFAGGAVIVTLPVAVIVIAVVAVLDIKRRGKQAKNTQDFREQAKSESVDFTERDQRTLTNE